MLREELLKKRASLEREWEAIQEQLKLIDRLLELNPDEGKIGSSPDPGVAYASMSVPEAIAHFLESRRYQFTLPREIKEGLLAGGISTRSARFENVVYNECDRMVTRQQLELGESDGKKAYRLKEPKVENL